MNMEVRITDPDWSARLPIFCSDRFLRTISDEFGWVEGIDDLGIRRCILPFCVIQKGGLRLVRFTAQTVATGAELSIDAEKAFLNAAVECFRRMRADLIIPPTFASLFRTFPDGAIAAPYGTYLVDLSQDESTLWKAVHPKHRNMVRSAERSGLRVRLAPESLELAAGLVEDSFRRSAPRFIDQLRLKWRFSRTSIVSEARSLGEHVAVLVAESQGQIQAAAIVPFSEPSAYYLHGGSADGARPGAMNLLQWEIMKHFKALGVRSYNFVGARLDPEPGSKQEGIVNFKKRFGGVLVAGFMWKYVLSPSRGWVYAVASRLRGGGDVVDQERHKLWAQTSR
jgi:hypothetical protein